MSVKLLAEHHLEFLSFKGGCTGHLSLHLSKYHIVGNHISRLKLSVAGLQIRVLIIQINLLMSQSNRMLWVLIRIISERQFYEDQSIKGNEEIFVISYVDAKIFKTF